MVESRKISEFEDGYTPKGKVVEFEKQPIVLRFPPSAYRVVEGDELKEWHREVQDRLGLNFDVGSGSGTVTFCRRGGTGAAYRCDCDYEPDSEMTADRVGGPGGRLRDWDSSPIVLHFPPVAYEVVEPDQLKGWVDDLRQRFGPNFDVGGGSGGTVSFCQRGGTGAAYRCDSDID